MIHGLKSFSLDSWEVYTCETALRKWITQFNLSQSLLDKIHFMMKALRVVPVFPRQSQDTDGYGWLFSIQNINPIHYGEFLQEAMIGS